MKHDSCTTLKVRMHHVSTNKWPEAARHGTAPIHQQIAEQVAEGLHGLHPINSRCEPQRPNSGFYIGISTVPLEISAQDGASDSFSPSLIMKMSSLAS